MTSQLMNVSMLATEVDDIETAIVGLPLTVQRLRFRIWISLVARPGQSARVNVNAILRRSLHGIREPGSRRS